MKAGLASPAPAMLALGAGVRIALLRWILGAIRRGLPRGSSVDRAIAGLDVAPFQRPELRAEMLPASTREADDRRRFHRIINAQHGLQMTHQQPLAATAFCWCTLSTERTCRVARMDSQGAGGGLCIPEQRPGAGRLKRRARARGGYRLRHPRVPAPGLAGPVHGWCDARCRSWPSTREEPREPEGVLSGARVHRCRDAGRRWGGAWCMSRHALITRAKVLRALWSVRYSLGDGQPPLTQYGALHARVLPQETLIAAPIWRSESKQRCWRVCRQQR